MRPTGFLVLASIATCGAAWLVSTGWRQPRPTLAASARHLRRPTGRDRVGHDEPDSLISRLGELVMVATAGERTRQWTATFRVIGRPISTHLGLLVVAALAGLSTPALILAVMRLADVVSVAVFVPAALSLLGAVAAPVAVHSKAIACSDAIRVDLRHQLSAYLDMVTMLLAGNSGHEGALEQAARAGDGMLFRELRRRMREVGTTGHSLVGALAIVGDDFDVVELQQVAAAATLSAAEGAPVARTLAAKCSTLRSTLAAEQEARARVRNDKVTPPLVGMALLFMALIIYPALNIS